jgi:hypothetical protein
MGEHRKGTTAQTNHQPKPSRLLRVCDLKPPALLRFGSGMGLDSLLITGYLYSGKGNADAVPSSRLPDCGQRSWYCAPTNSQAAQQPLKPCPSPHSVLVSITRGVLHGFTNSNAPGRGGQCRGLPITETCRKHDESKTSLSISQLMERLPFMPPLILPSASSRRPPQSINSCAVRFHLVKERM